MPQPSQPRGLALAALLAGPFMSMVDSSAVNVAIPEIVAATGAPLTTVGWVVSAYLLGIAAFLPLTTALAGRFGARQVYAAALAGFGVCSLLCAITPHLAWLIAARGLQGVASAALVPLALTLLFGNGEKEQGSSAAGALLFLAPVLGPTIGAALISTSLGWRGIFVVNIPLVIAALLLLRRTLAPPTQRTKVDIDRVALLLLGSGSILATLGTSLVGKASHTSWQYGLAVLVCGFVVLGIWVLRIRRRRGTDLAPYILASAGQRDGVLVSLLASVVLFGMLFLIPVYYVTTAEWSLWTMGLVLLPQGLAMGLAHPLLRLLTSRVSLRLIILLGLGLLVSGTALLVLLDDQTHPVVLAAVLVLRGIALGFILQPLVAGLVTSVPADQVAGVSTLFSISQRLGGALGIALLAAFFHSRAAEVGALSAFHESCWALAGLALLAVVPALFIRVTTPATSAQPQAVSS